MTFRLIPHVVEAGVAAGAGAAVAQRVRHHGGQALSAVPHPAAQAAGAAVSGRWAAVGAAGRAGQAGSAARPASPPAPSRDRASAGGASRS
jgi:hypothetical protein